jgi:hypothetical protein
MCQATITSFHILPNSYIRPQPLPFISFPIHVRPQSLPFVSFPIHASGHNHFLSYPSQFMCQTTTTSFHILPNSCIRPQPLPFISFPIHMSGHNHFLSYPSQFICQCSCWLSALTPPLLTEDSSLLHWVLAGKCRADASNRPRPVPLTKLCSQYALSSGS